MKAPTLLAVARHRGTEISNPFPSSGESGANLSLATIRLPTSRSRGFPRVCWLGRAARSTETRRERELLEMGEEEGRCAGNGTWNYGRNHAYNRSGEELLKDQDQ
jgi:hypothetical protein